MADGLARWSGGVGRGRLGQTKLGWWVGEWVGGLEAGWLGGRVCATHTNPNKPTRPPITNPQQLATRNPQPAIRNLQATTRNATPHPQPLPRPDTDPDHNPDHDPGQILQPPLLTIGRSHICKLARAQQSPIGAGSRTRISTSHRLILHSVHCDGGGWEDDDVDAEDDDDEEEREQGPQEEAIAATEQTLMIFDGSESSLFVSAAARSTGGLRSAQVSSLPSLSSCSSESSDSHVKLLVRCCGAHLWVVEDEREEVEADVILRRAHHGGIQPIDGPLPVRPGKVAATQRRTVLRN